MDLCCKRTMAIKIMLLILAIAMAIMVTTIWIWNQIYVKDDFVYSFDNQYRYIQLSSPEKTFCTTVILDSNNLTGRQPYSLPYYNIRTIKTLAWGLKSNELFVDSSDVGLTVYKDIDGNWMAFQLNVGYNFDGTYSYYLYRRGDIDQSALQYDLLRDTIPLDIRTQMEKTD